MLTASRRSSRNPFALDMVSTLARRWQDSCKSLSGPWSVSVSLSIIDLTLMKYASGYCRMACREVARVRARSSSRHYLSSCRTQGAHRYAFKRRRIGRRSQDRHGHHYRRRSRSSREGTLSPDSIGVMAESLTGCDASNDPNQRCVHAQYRGEARLRDVAQDMHDGTF